MALNLPQIIRDQRKTCTFCYFPGKGKSGICEYRVFPGVRLCLNRMDMDRMPAVPERRDDYLIINYGIRGRSQQRLRNGDMTFVAEGELALSFFGVRGDFVFPCGYYEGIEFYIDLGEVRKDRSEILSSMGIHLDQLRENYYGENGFFKSGHLADVDRVMKEIWQTKGDDSEREFSALCVDTLEFFRILLFQTIPESRYTNLSPQSVACAEQYRDMLTQDLARRVPAKEAAARFQISETSLKNYFRIVYGENVSVYMNRVRMETAEKLLAEGEETIGRIAEQVGFSGQNKFSAAFRAFSGVNPGEYRRMKRRGDRSQSMDQRMEIGKQQTDVIRDHVFGKGGRDQFDTDIVKFP